MNFYTGFEKRAEARDKAKENRRWAFMASIGGPAVASSVAGIAGGILNHLESSIPISEAKKFVDKINKAKGLKTQVREVQTSLGERIFRSAGAYLPGADVVFLPKKTSLSTTAHEMGHASMEGLLKKDKLVGRIADVSRKGAYGAGLLGTPIAMLGGDKDTKELAPYIAPLAATPVVGEEAIASIKGIKDIAKHKGKVKALRAIPSLIGALGTYAAAPAGSYYIAKKYLERNRKKRKDQ